MGCSFNHKDKKGKRTTLISKTNPTDLQSVLSLLPFKSTFMPKYSLEKNNTNSNLSSEFVLFTNGGALVT